MSFFGQAKLATHCPDRTFLQSNYIEVKSLSYSIPAAPKPALELPFRRTFTWWARDLPCINRVNSYSCLVKKDKLVFNLLINRSLFRKVGLTFSVRIAPLSVLEVFVFGFVKSNYSIMRESVKSFTESELSLSSENWLARKEDVNLFALILNGISCACYTVYKR